jgi:hypothetical protein
LTSATITGDIAALKSVPAAQILDVMYAADADATALRNSVVRSIPRSAGGAGGGEAIDQRR